MLCYDESEIKGRASRMDRARRTAFSAACAERLAALFERYFTVTGQGDPLVLGGVLESVWRVVQGGPSDDLNVAMGTAESMVPTDEDGWTFEMGYAQNAAAAVAYALRTWLLDDPHEVVWAARQVYEAADYVAQSTLSPSTRDGSDLDALLLGSRAVRAALAGLEADLMGAEHLGDDGWEQFRKRARDEGSRWMHEFAS